MTKLESIHINNLPVVVLPVENIDPVSYAPPEGDKETTASKRKS